MKTKLILAFIALTSACASTTIDVNARGVRSEAEELQWRAATRDEIVGHWRLRSVQGPAAAVLMDIAYWLDADEQRRDPMNASTKSSSAPIASAESVNRRRLLALLMGLLNHGTFLVAVAAMLWGLFNGLTSGHGPFTGTGAWLANTLLVLQFPLLHSFLLTTRGRAVMARLFGTHGRTLAPTTYTWSAALQILAVFALWSPSGTVWWQPHGVWLAAHTGLFLSAWAFLLKALYDGGMGLQTGSIGWLALLRGTRPAFPPMPTRGTFALCRQPIYLGFALTLWTGPIWTPDRLLLALAWTTYCAIGPRHKERRFLAFHGEEFARYQRRVPYMLPLGRRAA